MFSVVNKISERITDVAEEKKTKKTAKVTEETVVEEKATVVEETTETEVTKEVVHETVEDAVQEEEVLVDEQPRGKREARSKRRRIEHQESKPESEWKERVIQIRRVTKVVKGGKKLSFRAIVIVGNQKGQVGIGCSKASEVIIAIQKAIADGRKNLINVPVFNTTIPHPIKGRSGAGNVMLRPASQGTGVIAGGAVRAVLELAGIENILAKSLGSKSPLNAANATLNALKSLSTFSDAAKRRGITVKQMLN